MPQNNSTLNFNNSDTLHPCLPLKQIFNFNFILKAYDLNAYTQNSFMETIAFVLNDPKKQ